MLAAQATAPENSHAPPAIKSERRDSTTSESSLEHLDLGRTPKRLNTHSSATSTPHVTNNSVSNAAITDPVAMPRVPQRRLHDSDETNDYDDDDSTDEKQQSASSRLQRHHKRRNSGRVGLDKRTSVQLEYNADNPNSMRKKFRFNRSGSETPSNVISAINNESGFVDASSTSQFLNASAVSNTQQPEMANQTSQRSSASSSPHEVRPGSASSPESGLGEREDMKYLCPICEVVSATPHEFTNHIRCHNYASGDTENFTCRICSKVLSSASSLDRHVLVHTGERPFNCKYCHLTFTTNGNMHRHMRTHKQHQHNHHHRRNSNGTKNNNTNSNNSSNSHANTSSLANTNLAAAFIASAPAQSLNGEGVKTASATFSAPPTVAGASGKRLNGSGVESYESDGGCSTDSSSAISQSSNKNQSVSHNNNNNHNTKTNNNNVNNFKRKNSDHLDGDELALLKRRVKTTINNNIIGASDENHQHPSSVPSAVEPVRFFVCPVCNASDFDSMHTLAAHMDSAHAEIPAKCRHCDVVFRTHRQLNVHPCTHKLKVASPFELSLIAKSLCEQTLRTGPPIGQRFECTKCSAWFAAASALESHTQECLGDTYKSAEESVYTRRIKQRSLSESSTGYDEIGEEEQQRRSEFFRHLYLGKSKPQRAHSLNSLSSPHHSHDEALDGIKADADNEHMMTQHLLAQQSGHDSKDLADIQSILNMTSSSSASNFLKNFEQSVNTPSSNYGLDKDEEEAQDAFTSEFRKMKLRGEFPCKLCTAVFPNLRALKGHNRIHLSAVGPAGPFRCNMCPYSICDKAALVRHMRTHNGDRPYECAVCNYAFTTKANCERHLRNRHGKTTRDEVKRAIIYHPSEDSSCDDPTKKLHLFSSPDFDDDCELQYQQHQPKDRSTPVSHLKEMLTSDAKPLKIQVKSLEQLLDKSSYSDTYEEQPTPQHISTSDSAPMDLSMDVLDLSKKPSSKKEEKSVSSAVVVSTPEKVEEINGNDEDLNLQALEKKQQLLLAQQQLLDKALPSIMESQYLQHLYRNLVFPPLNPFNPFNSFLPNPLSDLHKLAPLTYHLLGGQAPTSSLQAMDTNKSNGDAASTMLPQVSPLMSDKSSVGSALQGVSSPIQQKPLRLSTPPPQATAALTIPRHPQMPPTVLPGNGPVKMVIKNGVLMPKQKQRRYRTERPFACEHCSARFTLRSNMERHVKQQHPQYYAQRQRSGQHVMRGRGASSASTMNSITHLQAAAFAQAHNNNTNTISDQVKFAILSQHLKARKDSDLLHQALAHGSSSVASNHMLMNSAGTVPNGQHFNFSHLHSAGANVIASMEDDEPKLIIDEDDEEDMDDDDVEEITDFVEEKPELNSTTNEIIAEEQLPAPVHEVKPKVESTNESAKKVAETILEQAIKAGAKPEPPAPVAQTASTLKSMIAHAETVGKSLKEVASSPFKDESDLASVSKLVDNATSNSVSFNSYFRPSDVANHMEQSDEEGLVASGSASESNNSGTEDVATCTEPKKKSAYSLAPNRVSCPYCQRMFPWSSSLRRHILTHTGQKPFKCSHCPLLFTTKSNCDRHLLRKHGNVESAVSVYVPTEDVTEPIPVPKSVEEIEQQQRKREEEERKRKSEEEQQERERREKERLQKQQLEQEQQLLKQLAASQFNQYNAAAGNSPKTEASQIYASELPFKCHLCESSFGERIHCLEHIKNQHVQEFTLLLAKGAIDTEADSSQLTSAEDDERRASEESERGRSTNGKYPDYSNRKVICAFCVRRFWSTEDLRRHMRTHSGERPFQCEICLRKFTLKHSMLRHMKKHSGRHHNGGNAGDAAAAGNSGSDFSDDEQTPMPNSMPMPSTTAALRAPKIQELLNKASEWRSSRLSTTLGEQKENIGEDQNNCQTDLIGNLLGISDQGILNKLLSSADEAAKLLGVDK